MVIMPEEEHCQVSVAALTDYVTVMSSLAPRELSERLGYDNPGVRRKEAKHYSRDNYRRNGKHHALLPCSKPKSDCLIPFS